jgi:DNA-directed RNA polymerase subunit omega
MKNKDGLRYPSIDRLLEVVDSKFKLAYIAARRAKDIQGYEDHFEDYQCSKPVGIALEEIIEGKVMVKFEDKAEE